MVEEDGGKIVVTGRGGSGKTSFTAFAARYLVELGWMPLLLVDSDPDESLASMVGFNLDKEDKTTISEIFYDIVEDKTKEISSEKRIEPIVIKKALFRDGDAYDFISLGPKWFEGCYCAPDRVLGNIMESLSNSYKYTIVDSPAGVEHLNRKITKEVKDVFNILDPSKKSFENARRTKRIMDEVDIEYENYYLVGGYLFPAQLESKAREQKIKYLGKIEYDEKVFQYNFEGKPLFQLSNSSPAYESIKTILDRAGYEKKPLSLTDLLNLK